MRSAATALSPRSPLSAAPPGRAWVAATASAIASSSASFRSSSITSRSSVSLLSGDFRLNPLAFEIASHRRQPALEAHLYGCLAAADQARDLGEGAAFEQLQADHPPLLVRELRDRLADRVGELAAVLRRRQFVTNILKRHLFAVLAVATR